METRSLGSYLTGNQAALDQTAIGLVRRLMQAGILVRLLLWYPPHAEAATGLGPHIADHFYAAQVVAAENKPLMAAQAPADGQQIGVVALDMRTADGHLSPTLGSHHQKSVVIRGVATSVASSGESISRIPGAIHHGDKATGNQLAAFPTPAKAGRKRQPRLRPRPRARTIRASPGCRH